MELRHLRYVIAAAEYKSFRRAAQALGVEQSAVSRRIRDLEDRLGVGLFTRHSGGVDLTDAGANFLERARKAVDQINHAAQDAGAAGRGESGVVRIGVMTSLASGFLADLLRDYGAQNPGIRPTIVDAGPRKHIAAIQQRQLDVAFLAGIDHGDYAHCDIAHLWHEGVFVALPESHHLTVQDEVTWKDLRAQRMLVRDSETGSKVFDWIARHLTALGYRPDIERCRVDRDGLVPLVAVGWGLSLISGAATATLVPGVVYRPLATEPLSFRAVWLPENDNPAFRRLLSLAKAMSK